VVHLAIKRARVLGQLVALEEKEKHYARAIEHLTELHSISPNKPAIQKWIDELKAKQTP
jgi:hypothetical protein